MKPAKPSPKRPQTAQRPNPKTQTTTDDILESLPKLIALWPGQVDVSTHVSRTTLLKILQTALRKERARGLSGHWAYNLARHEQMLKAFQHIKYLDVPRKPDTKKDRATKPRSPRHENTSRHNDD